MTNNNLPRVISFDQIKPGQLIEHEWTFKGVRCRAEGVAHYLGAEGTQWRTADGGLVVASTENTDTLRVLAEPPMPALPTEGFIEAWGTPLFCKEEIHLVVAMLNADGYWRGLTEAGKFAYLSPNQITRWRAVTVAPVDPTAPKPEPAPVTVLEVTEDDFAAITCDKPCPGRGYYCTRPEGHDGLHIAAITGHGVYAYWGEVQP